MQTTTIWQCGSFSIDLDPPAIMAILNTTPDSFSGDGLHRDHAAVIARARHAIDNGARILDVGGESSRPGSDSVPVEEEIARVVPVVKALVGLGVPVSVDTVKPEVMRAGIAAGAAIINDINALRAPGALEAVSASDAGVCLMHMRGAPRSMQEAPAYEDVIAEVEAFLLERLAVLEAAGIARQRITLDPGFGFGKTLEHNLALFRAMERLGSHGVPLLIGVSRKTMIGAITGRAVGERMPGSVAAAVLAVQRGAGVVRVHDVAETRDALAVWAAVERRSVLV